MPGNALEVAIALWRMPAMRATLRQRPLPEGVGEVIELAAGNPQRVASAADRLQERPAEILEAARFYVREVLLHDDDDAYRILGLAPDAGQAQVKAHHRALQHWLHPDRRGDDWDSVFAARINKAWSELRTPERRAAYDAGVPSAPAEPPRRRRLVTRWRAGPDVAPAWRRLAIPILALAACAWLLVLAGRQATAPPPAWVDEAEDPADPALSGLRSAAGTMAPRVATEWPLDVPAAAPTAASAPAQVRDRPAETGNRNAPVEAVGSAAPSPSSSPDAAAPMIAVPGRDQGADAAGMLLLPDAAEPSPEVPGAPAAAPAAPSLPSARRVQLAQAAARDVTGYLRGEPGLAPPVWGTVSALDTAEVLRMRLGAIDPRGTGSVRFGPPVWRISNARATMTAAIEAGSPGAQGTLQVELAWRDGMWLVEALHTEPRQ